MQRALAGIPISRAFVTKNTSKSLARAAKGRPQPAYSGPLPWVPRRIRIGADRLVDFRDFLRLLCASKRRDLRALQAVYRCGGFRLRLGWKI
jgi:hypothetical protein